MKKTIGNWKKYDAAIGAKGPVLKGNCTTRAITYALKANYDEVFARQHDIADKCVNLWCDIHYNTNPVSDKILREAGYRCVKVSYLRAGDFAKLAKAFKHPIVIETSGHMTICDKGEVVDTWDSTTRFVKMAWVKSEDLELVRNIPHDELNDWWCEEFSEFENFMRDYKRIMTKRIDLLRITEEKLNEWIERIMAA